MTEVSENRIFDLYHAAGNFISVGDIPTGPEEAVLFGLILCVPAKWGFNSGVVEASGSGNISILRLEDICNTYRSLVDHLVSSGSIGESMLADNNRFYLDWCVKPKGLLEQFLETGVPPLVEKT